MTFNDDEIEIHRLPNTVRWSTQFGKLTTKAVVIHKETRLRGEGLVAANTFEVNLHNAKVDLAKKLKHKRRTTGVGHGA